MRPRFIMFLILTICLFTANAQVSQKTHTDPENGIITTSEYNLMYIPPQLAQPRFDELWQSYDPIAICGDVLVSSDTRNSFARWQTNSERISLFDYYGSLEWDHYVGDLDFDYPVDMREDGSVLAAGDDSILKIFSPDSSQPYWSLFLDYPIRGTQLCANSDDIIISYYNEAQNTSSIAKYSIGSDTPLWVSSLPGGCGTLTLSDDDSTLIFTQYGGEFSFMYVFETENGSHIFQTTEYNQNPPAVSADGSIIVNGDYSGYVWVYEFDDASQSYQELWHYHVNGGGSSDWIGGMAISADGSTIAVGTLTFIPGGYNGQIYLFDTTSPTPIWIYENAGDYVIDVDISDDGSIIAAAGYGPYGATGDEFFLFRRQSNIPVFTIDSPGSLFAVDLAADGSFCTAGGKAVHAREMGNGGYIYSIDCALGGGHLAGSVILQGSDAHDGVRVEISELIDYYTFTNEQGNYTVSHVPEGLYTVTYTKTGYQSYTSFDGLVIEGETTLMETVSLSPNGEAPINLTASQAAAPYIELSWQAPPSGDPEGYFVYRKRYNADPYPLEPLAIVFDENYCLDLSALPLITYYYVVTAMTDEGDQTPFSNEAAGWTSSGFIAEDLNVYIGTTPNIDAVIDDGEWDDAFRFDASDFWGTYDGTPQPIGSVIGYLKMNTEQTELYAAFINYNDHLLEDHDEVAFYIDDNADGSFPPPGDNSEGNYWAVYYAAGNELRYRPIYNTGSVGDVQFLANPLVAASDDTGFVVYEFMIPLGEEDWKINPGPDNSSTLAIFVLDDNEPDPHGFDSWWPHDNINLFDAEGFGVINYAASPSEPMPPQNVSIENLPGYWFHLAWDMPQMNDFSHFNIYFAIWDTNFELIDYTQGTSWLYQYEFSPQTSYSFYITTVNLSGSESAPSQIVEYFTSEQEPHDLPFVNSLKHNYPNPFNPFTTIFFSTASDEYPTSINIYNIKGQKVITLIDEIIPAGNHQITWNGKNQSQKSAPSGLYLYSMKNGNFSSQKKMIMIK
jgi:hypothetical protein